MSATATVPGFTRKKLDLTITRGQGTFGETGTDTVTLSGLRASAAITKQVGPSRGAMDLRVFGLTPSIMRQVTQYQGFTGSVIRNDTATLTAGDENGMSTAWTGPIQDAWIDFAASPDVCLHILGLQGQDIALAPAASTSYQGGVSASSVLAKLAGQCGLNFEDGGVSGVLLHDPYWPGTAYDQIRACAQAARVGWIVEDGTLAVWPQNGSRSAAPLISVGPDNGLVGYPTTYRGGVGFTMVYRGTVNIGGKVKLTSGNLQAAGTWLIVDCVHNLEAELPGGAWFSTLHCSFIPGGSGT